MEKHQIQINDLYKKGVHFEELKDFKKSIFSDVYKSAGRCVEQIVKDNENNRDVGWPRKKSQGNQIESVNTISFIGQRGAGKTSALLFFSKGLEQHGTTKYGSIFEDKSMDNIQFFSLSCIDAAILENAENIFVLILANMLKRMDKQNEFSRLEENYDKQEILKNLENIYSEFKSLKENDAKDQEWMYSIYERFKNLSSSQRIREHFASLVQKYLKYLSEQESDNKTSAYLVISIDDIDMSYYNLSSYNSVQGINPKSYEIMNNIQKYLSVPGVIVLVSYNDENLHQQCQSFFAKSNSMHCISAREKEIAFKESAYIAVQFMEKVFSPVYRVYMPSWKKADLEETRMEIVLKDNGEHERLFAAYLKNEKSILRPKQFVLALYALRTGIYYDPLGEKKHFLEPNSLRELSDMFHLLMESESVIERTENENFDYENVIMRIQNDVYFRFIQEKLVVLSELKKFQQWLEIPVDRRARVIVQEMKDKAAPLGKSIKNQIAKLETEKQRILKSENVKFKDLQKIESTLSELKHIENEHYGFSELVHAIYHMSREQNQEGVTLYSKEFVACILHSFSVQLSKCYNEYQNAKKIYNSSEMLLNPNYIILKKIIGNSIFGHWAEYLVPEVFSSAIFEMERKRTTIAYIDNIRKRTIVRTPINTSRLMRLCQNLLFRFPDIFRKCL